MSCLTNIYTSLLRLICFIISSTNIRTARADGTRARLWVHVPEEDKDAAAVKKTLALLKRAPGANTTTVYSSPVKQALVNAFLETLPRDALLMCAAAWK